MRYAGLVGLLVTLGLLVGVVTGSEIGLAPSRAAPANAQAGAAAAQDTVPMPRPYLTAAEVPDGVRYTVAINRAPRTTLRDVRVDVQLPAGAQLVEAYETPGFTQLLGSDGGGLRWAAPLFAPGPYVDSFTFLLRQASPANMTVTVSWDGDRPGRGQVSANPQPMVGSAVAGEIVLGPEATRELVPSEEDPNVMVPHALGGVPVGDTGIFIAIPENAVPAGTVVRVRKLAPDQDPPAAAGDLWWCAVVEVTGLPPGVEAYLWVPARRPLPPLSAVALFTQRDGRWERSERNGQADVSGQYVELPTRGGIVATGTAPGVRNQAVTSGAGAARPVATPIAVAAQPPRTLPSRPTPVAGALPTPTPVGTLFQFTADTTAAQPEPVGPLRTRNKMRQILDVGNCNINDTSAGGCDNDGNGATVCGEILCSGTINQEGLLRRDGHNSCTFTPGGGNPRCVFTRGALVVP